jgi:hypothetical protein
LGALIPWWAGVVGTRPQYTATRCTLFGLNLVVVFIEAVWLSVQSAHLGNRCRLEGIKRDGEALDQLLAAERAINERFRETTKVIWAEDSEEKAS